MTTATIGTIIHGTMRTQDILPELLRTLKELADGAVEAQLVLQQPIPAHALEDDDAEWWDSEEAADMVQTLMSDLDEYAPPYCYCGSHPGDGSDIGFWPDLDAIEELPHVGDPAELDQIEDSGEAVHVNDHGNVSLYVRDENSDWVMAWDIV